MRLFRHLSFPPKALYSPFLNKATQFRGDSSDANKLKKIMLVYTLQQNININSHHLKSIFSYFVMPELLSKYQEIFQLSQEN